MMMQAEAMLRLQLARLGQTRQMVSRRADNIELSMHVDTTRMHVIQQPPMPLLLSCRIHGLKANFPEMEDEDGGGNANSELFK